MKIRRLILFTFISLIFIKITAQIPEKMSYQAIIRNADDHLVANKIVGMQVSILKGSEIGEVVYSETHAPKTTAEGLISIEIGAGNKSWWRPNFKDINWADDIFFLKTEVDLYGGNNYSIVSSNQILSVPYALHAKTAESISGPVTEVDPVFSASVAAELTQSDTANWNNKQDKLVAGKGIIIEGDVISINPNYFIDSLQGIAKNYINDENIQFDPDVIFASGFENGFTGWSSYNNEVSKIVNNSDSAFSGNKVLKTTATRNVNTGGDVTFKFPEGQDQIYLRFYTKLDKNTIIPHHFVKIQAMVDGFWGNAGQAPPGDKGYWTGIEPLPDYTWNLYTYWHEMHSWQTWAGVPDGRPNPYYGNVFHVAGQKPLILDEWICVEAMLKANTPNQYDGEQAFWINGKKIGHWKKGEPFGEWRGDKFVIDYGTNPQPFEGYNFRTVENLKINSIILRWYISEEHMISKNATQDDNSVYFDNVVVSTKYIGPMYDENGPVYSK